MLVLLWAHATDKPWAEIGFARPRHWAVTVGAGIAIGVVAKLVMKALVMPLLGAWPVNRTYQYLTGNRAQLPLAILMMFVAGFGEETVFRGFAFERLGKLWGKSRGARVATVLLTAALFAAAHLADQGRDGAVQALITGTGLGMLYLATGSIWMSMIAHTAFDLAALWIIYYGLETRVAHAIFG